MIINFDWANGKPRPFWQSTGTVKFNFDWANGSPCVIINPSYEESIKSLERDIKPKVEIYFDGIGEASVILSSDNIANIDPFLEEAQADGDNPLGVVSANEINITLRNDDQYFNPNNEDSPYYGKMHPNVLIKPYLGLRTTDISGYTSFEWISLGYFYSTNWEAESDSIYAEVLCHDRLYDLGQKDTPLIPTMQNVTRYQMFETLFRALGLGSDNYEIDISLQSDTIPIGYFYDGKVKTVLSKLAEAFNCSVFCTRDNKIKVLSNSTVGASVITMSDSDLIKSSDMPQDFDSIYSDITIKYYHHNIEDVTSVLTIDELDISAAGSTLTNLKFTLAPVAFVDHIRITDNPYISINSVAIGTWGMDISFDNSAPTNQQIKLEVLGYPIMTIENEITERDDTAYALIGEKILDISNPLIQLASDASALATVILPIVADPKAYIECETRGDMSRELGETITIDDDTNKVGEVEIIPIRYDYAYDGGLECFIRGIKKSLRES